MNLCELRWLEMRLLTCKSNWKMVSTPNQSVLITIITISDFGKESERISVQLCCDPTKDVISDCQNRQLKCRIRSVSCTSNWHPIPGDRAPAVTMIGCHVTALGCRRRRPARCKWQLKMASTFKRLVIWQSVYLLVKGWGYS